MIFFGTMSPVLHSGYRRSHAECTLLGGCTRFHDQFHVGKVINKTCSDLSINTAIEGYSAKNGACFSKANCATGLDRNTSATCWIDCFYEVLLGPGGGQPGGAITGMPVEILFDAWSKPFESDDPTIGGCPAETDYTMYGTGADKAELRSRGGLYRGVPVPKK